jgi:hypothetical protein
VVLEGKGNGKTMSVIPTVSSKWNVGFQAQEQLRTVLLTEWKAATIMCFGWFVASLRSAANLPAAAHKTPFFLLITYYFSLLVLEGVIIDSRTEPRSRISLLLVNNFSLLPVVNNDQPSSSNERFSLISLVNVDRLYTRR